VLTTIECADACPLAVQRSIRTPRDIALAEVDEETVRCNPEDYTDETTKAERLRLVARHRI